MSFTTALYYPWIDIQDEHWLRSACLYWDRLHTIVPASIRRPYEAPASRELFDAGVLEPVRVEPGLPEIQALAADVIAYLQSPEGTQLLARPQGKREQIHSDKLPFELTRLTRIHPEKLPYEIPRILETSRQKDGWLRVDPQFADFYMTLLANRIAEQRGLGLLTSSFAADRLANTARSGRRAPQDVSSVRPTASSQLIEGIVVDMVLGGFSIAPNVRFKKILSFRRRHSAELGRLRTKIGELAKSVPGEATPEAMRQHVHDLMTNEVTPAVVDLRAALRGDKINVLTEGLLKVTFLSAAPTSALVLAGFLAPTALAVGAGISVIATAALMAVSKRKTLRESPFAYLLAVNKKFS